MRSKDKDLMKRIVEFVNSKFENTGRTPTYREIGEEFSVTEPCVSKYIKEMTQLGMLICKGGSRGLVTEKMQKMSSEIVNLPVVGSISCGALLLAEENIDRYVPIPKSFLGNGEYFILVANGNSMIEANISSGDLVIVKKQSTAEEGQIIVALIDDEATLKRFYKDNKKRKIRLHPENKDMEDMFFDHVEIQGIAIKVVKDLF